MGKADDKRAAKAVAAAKADERRRVVLRVFQDVDTAGAKYLAASTVAPSCTDGCSHCCHLEIPMTRAEGETIVAWLVEHRTADELEAIRVRLHGWLAWYREAYRVHLANGLTPVEAFFRHGPACALLVDHRCSAYPVRPITCRNHFVSSAASVCDPAIGDGDVTVMTGVGQATYEHVAEIRKLIERQNGNFIASVHRLPEWLAHLLDVEREPWVGAPIELGL